MGARSGASGAAARAAAASSPSGFHPKVKFQSASTPRGGSSGRGPGRYSHLSGSIGSMTGRATARGVGVRGEEGRLLQLANEIGITFALEGAPSQQQLLASRQAELSNQLDAVPQEARDHFRGLATELLEQRGVDALAAALAALTGFQDGAPQTYSILAGRPNFVTVEVEMSRKLAKSVRGVPALRHLLLSAFPRMGQAAMGKVLQLRNGASYLLDLEDAGVPVVPSVIHRTRSGLPWAEVCQTFASMDVVIKPTVSGAAKDTFRVTRCQNKWHLAPAHPDPIEDLWASLLGRQDMMVQPFLPSVVAEGELSLMWLGGTVTHAVKKQAKPGDFRVQDDHGGTVVPHVMTSEERAFANHAMAAAVDLMAQRDMGTPLYARVDIVRDLNGAWAVSELEMVEPELWFRMCPEAALVLAQAIAELLTKPGV